MVKKILLHFWVASMAFVLMSSNVSKSIQIANSPSVEESLIQALPNNASIVEKEVLSNLSLSEKLVVKVAEKKVKKELEKKNMNGEKSQVVALVLVLLVGTLGIHRFYLGYTWQGVVQLLTAGGCGVWTLIDLIRIVTGNLKPKDGDYAKKL
ncbi:MAG: TM2 domain-containing protein [Cytophagales bacterium]|nr:TM2 domain-containing protein [Cytophagales bacterium]MDW8384227.1 TM2 domain-containing protein [Flammeovirgaceae bacterium]